MQLEVVKKLANLARIDMEEVEIGEIAKDFDTILAYIGQVEEAATEGGVRGEVSKVPESYHLFNIMSEDSVTNKSGEYTDKIMDIAPNTENGYLKVKQIL